MIPKKLHFIWIGDDGTVYQGQMASWKNHHPGWEVNLWDNNKFLSRHWRLARQMKEIGHRDVRGIVELMRMEILHDEGGVAIDVDSTCVRSIPLELLEGDAFSCWVDEIRSPGVLSTSFVGAAPRCSALGTLLAEFAMDEAPLTLPIEESVGNRRFTRLWRERGFAGITVCPSHYFLSADRGGAGIAVEGPVIGLHERATTRSLPGVASQAIPAKAESNPDTTGGGWECTVSVFIRCFRQAEYLPLSIASVVAQTFTNWEIVVVNDGSPDDTSSVVAGLAAQYGDRRIRLIEQENGGLSNALNAGVRASRGKYVLPLDADDAIDPTFLARTVEILNREPDVSIVHTDVAIFGARNGIWRTANPFDVSHLARENGLAYASLYRRNVWDEVGGYASNMTAGYEDWDFWLSAAACGFRARHIPEALMWYREKNAQSMLAEARRHDAALRARLMLNHAQLYPPELLEAAHQLLAQTPLPPKKPEPIAKEVDLRGRRVLHAA